MVTGVPMGGGRGAQPERPLELDHPPPVPPVVSVSVGTYLLAAASASASACALSAARPVSWTIVFTNRSLVTYLA